jgi:hypothetical protein
VLQPISVDPSGRFPTTTLDAAVHVIYALPRDAFADLVRGIVAARPSPSPSPLSSPTPLGVHPVLASEGLAGPYARAIEGHAIAAAGKGHLTRVTFLGSRGRGNEWQLGGVSVAEDGTTSPLGIPSSQSLVLARIQSIVLQQSGAASFAKSISPKTAGDDDISILLDSSVASAASRDDVAQALRAANRIENPNIRTSENTDCATCHTVASSRIWADQKLSLRDDRDRFLAPGFDLSAPATTTSTLGDLGALRALGYFGAQPVVSPRAIHDTAKAAQWIASTSRDTDSDRTAAR